MNVKVFVLLCVQVIENYLVAIESFHLRMLLMKNILSAREYFLTKNLLIDC